ncbi:MAG: ATP-binding cassette domain-containing protein, partial [Muribaculaceae bacterium]|nr:ATP-binding cassette domain-containing protein [Muribaculaceae bacterium]
RANNNMEKKYNPHEDNNAVPCEVCGGQRFKKEVLEIKNHARNISAVLDMTIDQAIEFFSEEDGTVERRIVRRLQPLHDVGLGYIKLGHTSSTLSGGENQRVKLATELAKRDTGKTIFVLDEPTTGLHFDDIRVLMAVLNRLVDKGNTVVVIEHNTDVIKCADHIIDMGPEGGSGGGLIIAEGTPEQVALTESPTAPFIRSELKTRR